MLSISNQEKEGDLDRMKQSESQLVMQASYALMILDASYVESN